MTRIPAYRAYNTHLHVMQPVLAIELDPEMGGVEVWGKSVQDFLTGEHEAERDFWPWNEVELMEGLPFSARTQNGTTEVYEGDLVATGIGPEYTLSIVRIGNAETAGSDHCYAESYYGVYLEGSTGLEDILLRGEMYVIGNVWQHAHLLEAQP